MKNISLFFILMFTFSSIVGGLYLISEKTIINPTDYESFMTASHFEEAKQKLQNQIKFWETKLENAPNNFVYQKKIAGLYATDFKLTGDIRQLEKSDALFAQINQQIPNQVGVLHSMSLNAVTRHDFRAAEKYANEALEIGERKYISSLLKTDALLERGNLWEATNLMQDLFSTSQFDFLVRSVKIKDQSGHLGMAINDMEKALELAEKSGNPNLINWSLSNLADMYGHDGRIQKSYNTYLKALAHNPADLHSLKGIAWIAFSQDKNTEEAKRIISFLQTIHPVPDYDLLLSEIAAFENNKQKATEYEANFLARASHPEYGNMYQSYIGFLEKKPEKILKIAQSEIKNRPNPMSYNLLAWANFQKGEQTKAVEILEKYVIGQTEEPDALFYSGIILKETGKEEQAKEILEEALEASFELGPMATLEIEKCLAAL